MLIIFAKRFKFTAAWSIYFICVRRLGCSLLFSSAPSDILAMLLLFKIHALRLMRPDLMQMRLRLEAESYSKNRL
jgi:hypothetical protein